jgi:hypothetical protein
MQKTRRLSVRIDENLAMKLEALMSVSGSDLSTLVKEALTQLCETKLALKAEPWEAWHPTGLIGSASGPSDLSTGYKKYLSKELAKKHSL